MAYMTGQDTVLRFNRFGTSSSTNGDQLKDRSKGFTAAYNSFEGVKKGYALNIDCQCETGSTPSTGDPSLVNSVLGNVIVRGSYDPNAVDTQTGIIHFGGSLCGPNIDTTFFRKNLRFYNNTIISRQDHTRFFVLSSSLQAADARNNVFYVDSATVTTSHLADEENGSGATLTLTHNWRNQPITDAEDGAVVTATPPDTQGSTGQDPGFVNVSVNAVRVKGASTALVDQGIAPDPSWTPVDGQYLESGRGQSRTVVGSAIDIGAYESPAAPSTTIAGLGAVKLTAPPLGSYSGGWETNNSNVVRAGSGTCGGLLSHAWSAVSDASYSGGTAMQALPNDAGCSHSSYSEKPRLDVVVYFPSSGTYSVWVRGKAPSSSSNVVTVSLDRSTGAGALTTVTLPDVNTLEWKSSAAAVTVANAGFHTISLIMSSTGFIADQVWLGTGRASPGTVSEGTRVAYAQPNDTNAIVAFDVEHSEGATSGTTVWTYSPLNFSPVTGFDGSGASSPLPDAGVSFLSNWASSAPRLDFQVKFAAAGRYYIWVRGYGPADGNSIHIGLDGIEEGSPSTVARFASSGSGWQWRKTPEDQSLTAGYIDVEDPGYHVINLWVDEDGFTVDKVFITLSSTYDPTVNGDPAETGAE